MQEKVKICKENPWPLALNRFVQNVPDHWRHWRNNAYEGRGAQSTHNLMTKWMRTSQACAPKTGVEGFKRLIDHWHAPKGFQHNFWSLPGILWIPKPAVSDYTPHLSLVGVRTKPHQAVRCKRVEMDQNGSNTNTTQHNHLPAPRNATKSVGGAMCGG